MACHGRSGAVYPVGSGTARPLREYIETLRDAIDLALPLGLGKIPYGPQQVMFCRRISPSLRRIPALRRAPPLPMASAPPLRGQKRKSKPIKPIRNNPVRAGRTRMDEQEPDSIYAVDLPKVKAVCLILSHRAAGGVFAGYLRAPFAVAGLAVLAFAWWYAVCKTPQVKQVGQEEQGITLSVPKLVLLFALMLLWGYLGGQTGFFTRTRTGVTATPFTGI